MTDSLQIPLQVASHSESYLSLSCQFKWLFRESIPDLMPSWGFHTFCSLWLAGGGANWAFLILSNKVILCPWYLHLICLVNGQITLNILLSLNWTAFSTQSPALHTIMSTCTWWTLLLWTEMQFFLLHVLVLQWVQIAQ